MSESEAGIDPVPVVKDPGLVNGDDTDELPPPVQEIPNGLNKPVTDMSNGVDHEAELNGDMEVPVNGDVNMNGNDVMCDEDLMGGEMLPPPPPSEEVVSELPPPPGGDLLMGGSIEPESHVDDESLPEQEVVQNQAEPDNKVDEIGDIPPAPEVPVAISAPVMKEDELSEEELVSDGGLKDEVDVEIQDNTENEQSEGQLVDVAPQDEPLVDVGVPEPTPIPEPIETPVPVDLLVEPVADVPVCEPEPEPEHVPMPPEVIIQEPEMEPEPEVELEPEVEPEPEVQPEPVVQQEPEIEPVPEVVLQEQPPEVVETQEEIAQEPVEVYEKMEQPSEPEPVPVIQVVPVEEEEEEPVPAPTQEPEIQEEIAVQPPAKEVEIEPVQPEVETEPEPEAPVEPQTLVGYAEPAIITDNKPVDDEPVMDEPPPPPPPLAEETPPPPPPLDESVQLKRDSRRSGESTPNKQSPCKELDSPIVEEALKFEEPAPEPEPARVPTPEPVQQEAPEPVEIQKPAPVPAPILIPEVAEVKHAETAETEDVSIPGSPPRSPSNVSEGGSDGQPAVVTATPSPKINKKNFKSKIKFGVDLIEAALKQLAFLSCVNKNSSLYEEWLFKKAIRRYEAFWLPMAAEHKKESLAAPLDIEWVWHCHLLSPQAYEADCKKLVGLVVEHKVMSEKDRTKALEKSKKYWTAKYPSEPFEIALVYKEKTEEPVAPVTEAAQPATETAGEANTENTEQTAETEQPKTDQVCDEVEPAQGGGDKHEATPTEGEGQAAQDATVAPAEQPAPVPEATPAPVNVVPEEGYEQKCSYNIYAAILRQQVFFYQVCMQHYHDKTFLKVAVKRYQKFLFLKHQNPTEALVPCYDIDLIWHGHQLHPAAYRHDTVKVLGQLLNHDDSVNDRSPGSRLMHADKSTRDLWKTQFNEEFMVFGAMFRGEPPVLCEKMTKITPEQTYHFSTKKATVNLDKVQVEGLPEEVNKYSVKLTYGACDKEGPVIKQFKGNKKKMEFENAKKGLAKFVFDTKEFDSIKFDMTSQYGFACTGHSEEIGRQVFNLMPVVEGIPKNQSEAMAFTDSVLIEEENNLKAIFTANIDPPNQGPTMLFLNPGCYEPRFCIMPEQVVQMWGPVPLPRLPTGRDNNCLVASHKFVNHTGETTFTCRVIHSLPMLMSAVQVFYQGQIAAVAHLVGSDQVPLPSQLSDTKKIFSLNPGDDQRAVLIKNQSGDWGLVRGQWTGFRKHQPAVAATKGKKAKKEVPWCPGTLNVSFYKCSNATWQHLHLPYMQNDFKFNIQDSSVDVRTGNIEINSEPKEVAENVALAFGVSLLHVLCQPRYNPPPPPEPIPVATEVPQQEEEKKEEEKKEEEKEEPEKEEKKEEPAEEKKEEVAEGEGVETDKAKEDAAEVAPAEAPAPQEPAQAEAPVSPKTPKSPAKSEPATPSKKVKEIPAIPSFELTLVLAAGYNVETPTTEMIKHQYGPNACAGCSAVALDAGVGHFGKQVEAQQEVGQTDGGATQESPEGNDTDTNDAADAQQDMADVDHAPTGGDMDAMGDMGGDAGAAACGAF